MSFAENTFIYYENGELLICGYNGFGQLGLNDKRNRKIFERLMYDPNIKSIECGRNMSYILKENGDLYSFGHSLEGELGNGNNQELLVPTLVMNSVSQIKCGFNFALIYKNDGSICGFGSNQCGELGIGNLKNQNIPQIICKKVVISMACGSFHSVLLLENSDIMVFGNNKFGQLGITGDNNITTPRLYKNDKEVLEVFCGNFYGMWIVSFCSIIGKF
eukprot:TRINITY_DN4779_c0_g1_i1.p1 TRINITY_DN4779_c0_g1~~TRINITY_DN4779_c0_g1_i1.p1  ORF type:complete len:218 (-),score=41.24 TRINITY_DN4779_c0_g1_i1:116-769(-)